MSLTTPTLTGERILLRPLDVDDVDETYLSWLHDPQVVAHLESRFVEHTFETTRAFVAKMRADPAVHLWGVVETATSRHIGNVKLGPVDPHHRIADIGIMIGDRNAWGRGYATEAITLLAEWALGAGRVRKLTAGAYATNIASVLAFERAGFVVEAVRPRHAISATGDEVDAVLLGRHA